VCQNASVRAPVSAFTQPRLFVVDEVGYLRLDPPQASRLFQLIAPWRLLRFRLVLESCGVKTHMAHPASD
jgi:hypothetical protein